MLLLDHESRCEVLQVRTAHGSIGPMIDVLGERNVCLGLELHDGTMLEVAAAPRFADALGGPFLTAHASLRERSR